MMALDLKVLSANYEKNIHFNPTHQLITPRNRQIALRMQGLLRKQLVNGNGGIPNFECDDAPRVSSIPSDIPANILVG